MEIFKHVLSITIYLIPHGKDKKKINIYLEFKNYMAYGAEDKPYRLLSCKITLYIIYRFIKQ